jgi:hypothetical protein
MVTIIRMEPFDRGITFEYSCDATEKRLLMRISIVRQSCSYVLEKFIDAKNGMMTVDGLENGKDYTVCLTLIDEMGRIEVPSCTRLFTPFKNKKKFKIINYIHKDDYYFYPSGRSTCSPCLLVLPNGDYLCSHDVFWGHGAQNLTYIYISKDSGLTWHYLSHISPCFWGKLFRIGNIVYIQGMSTEYGDIMLHRSMDGGATWDKTVCLFKADATYERGFHQAPVPTVINNGRIWTAVEFGTWKQKFSIHVISCDIDKDLTEPSNWAMTGKAYVKADTEGLRGCKEDPVAIEGNVITGNDGRMYNMLRCNLVDDGIAILSELDMNDPAAPLKNISAVDLPLGHCKFVIRNRNNRYYAMGNRIAVPYGNKRQTMSLYVSDDLISWTFVKDLWDIRSTSDRKKAALQYPDWCFQNDDIIAVIRTAMDKPFNYHNANCITFHRYRNALGK